MYYGVNLFFGTITALGGSGAGVGGAGTVYTKANSQPWGLVVADNGGQAGTNTTWIGASTIDLTVKGGALAYHRVIRRPSGRWSSRRMAGSV